MEHSAHAGVKHSTGTTDGKPAGGCRVVRAAKFYMAGASRENTVIGARSR